MPRPMGVFKTENDYQQLIDTSVYEKMPKAIFAAIAVSFLLNHQNVDGENVSANLLDEWGTLHANGIVPQKPPSIKKRK